MKPNEQLVFIRSNAVDFNYHILRDFKLTQGETPVAHHRRIVGMLVHGFQQNRYRFLFDLDVQRRSFGIFYYVKQ